MSVNVESDYCRTVDHRTGNFLESSQIEIIHPLPRPLAPKHVLFDFDGTLSLIREGWMEVMVEMMVEILVATGTDEPVEALSLLTREFVTELTGKQTLYQMIRLAEEVKKRGGDALEPLAYKATYHDRLMLRIDARRERLRSGAASPEEMLVPGSVALLKALTQQGCQLYLASGTDEPYVKEEVALLGLDGFFGDEIYGALPDVEAFSKAKVIKRIFEVNQLQGPELLGFGDGYVEIQNVKEAGGTAVAVASDEAARGGRVDAWKRERLIGVGADIVVADYQEADRLLDHIWCG